MIGLYLMFQFNAVEEVDAVVWRPNRLRLY